MMSSIKKTNEIKERILLEKDELLNKLIGYQLIDIDERGFTVMKDGVEKTFIFISERGGCCGYNELKAELLISEEERMRNPIITDVEYEDISAECYDGQNIKITFMGECKPLALVDSYSSSGSGWEYGATVYVMCVETGEKEVLTQW